MLCVAGGVPVDDLENFLGETFGGVVINDAACVQTDDAVCEFPREIDLMEADHGRDSILSADVPEHPQQIPSLHGIEARDRLVREQEPWLLGKCASKSDALLFSAAELVGSACGFVEKPDPIERTEGEFLLPPRVRQERPPEPVISDPPQKHVVEGRSAPDELMLLEDHPGLTAVPPKISTTERFSLPVVNHTLRGTYEQIETAKQA